MKKWRFLLLFLLCSVLLSSTAGADVLPFRIQTAEGALSIYVVNAPEGEFYLDLLKRGEPDPVPWKYERYWVHMLIRQLKTTEQDGWVLAFTETNVLGSPAFGSHYPERGGPWNFYGPLPEEFRIAVATYDTAQATDEIYRSDSVHGVILYDWEANVVTASQIDFQSRPVQYVFQFLMALLATLMIEGAVLYLYGFRERRTWITFLIVNITTQLGLHAFCDSAVASASFTGSPLPLLLPELVIFAIEAFVFTCYMAEATGKRRCQFAVVANLVSYLSSVILLRLLSSLPLGLL